jgi:hypothetical protein
MDIKPNTSYLDRPTVQEKSRRPDFGLCVDCAIHVPALKKGRNPACAPTNSGVIVEVSAR